MPVKINAVVERCVNNILTGAVPSSLRRRASRYSLAFAILVSLKICKEFATSCNSLQQNNNDSGRFRLKKQRFAEVTNNRKPLIIKPLSIVGMTRLELATTRPPVGFYCSVIT